MVVARIEKELENEIKDSGIWGVVVEVHPSVARTWTEDGGKNIDILEKTLNCRIYLRENNNLHIEESIIHRLIDQSEAEKYFLEHKES